MGDSKHPITTPKGTSLLTVILAVIGVFTPFFTSLEAAQLFAAVAEVVIVWIYWEEARTTFASKTGYARLTLPAISMVLIGFMAIGATSIVDSRSSAPPPITISEVKEAVNSALSGQPQATPPPPIQTPTGPNYRVIVEQPTYLPGRTAAPKSEGQHPAIRSVNDPVILEPILRRAKRLRVGSEAWNTCNANNYKIYSDLYVFLQESHEYLNAYYYGRNDKLMVLNFEKWNNSIISYFDANKTLLPEKSLFVLANDRSSSSIFSSHKSGEAAWAEMTAKSNALQIIASQISSRSCETSRFSAEQKCLEDKTCSY